MSNEIPLASDLLKKAVKELNETDSNGAVSKIKMHIKLIQVNDNKIAEIQKHSKELLKEVTKLTAAGGLTADRFSQEA